MIWLKATGRMLTAICTERVTSGSVGMEAQFTFSDDWDGLTRTAVFKGSATQIDVLLTGDTCTIPWEVLQTSGGMLTIGVYGADGSGTVVIPTIWRDVRRIEPGTTPGYITPSPATQDELAQIREIAEAAEDKAPYIVEYDATGMTSFPDGAAVAAAFDAGKAVLAHATDSSGSGHILPLTEITRQNGTATRLIFSSRGWVLTASKPFSSWMWILNYVEGEQILTLTFQADWDSSAEAYTVSTSATLQQINNALVNNRRIVANLNVTTAEEFTDLKLRQGTVFTEYYGENIPSLVSADISFVGSSGELWVLSGTGDGWELDEIPVGGGSGAVDSVNGQTGAVVLTASDVGAGTYSKPSGGIPKSDLAAAVQTSLGKADTALQTAPVASVNSKTGAVVLTASDVGAGTYSKPSGGIPKSDLASAVQTSLGKADTAVQTETDPTVPSWAKSPAKPSYSYSEITGKPTLAAVATSGSYNDLSNKPTIPSLTGYQTEAITDTGGYFTNDTVEDALQEIGAELAGINTLIGSGVIT